jgi:hypothetical protein
MIVVNCTEVTVSETYHWHSTRLSWPSSLQAMRERLQDLLESPLWLISDLLWQRPCAVSGKSAMRVAVALGEWWAEIAKGRMPK